jgi:hypothetical protein
MIKIQIFSMLLAIILPSISEATQRHYSTHQYDNLELTYCHIHFTDAEWLYYKGLGQVLNAYIAERIKKNELQDKPFFLEIDCKQMSPVSPIEITHDKRRYSVYMHAETNLQELVQVVNYCASEYTTPITFDWRPGEWVEAFRKVLEQTVGTPDMTFFELMQVSVFELDTHFHIVYKDDQLWDCIDGVCLKVIDLWNEWEHPAKGDDTDRGHEVVWEGTSDDDDIFHACALATIPLRKAVYKACGGPQNVWDSQVQEWCECRYGEHPHCVKEGKFRCTE